MDSKKSNIILVTSVLFISLLMVLLSGCGNGPNGNSKEAIEGSWHCLGVRYGDDLLEAKGDQKNDYTAVVEGNNYNMTIYGVESSGTWEQKGETTTNDGEKVLLYTFTDKSNATFDISYFTKQDKLVLTVDTNQYVYFERD